MSSSPLGSIHLPGASDAIQLGLSPQRVVAILSILLLTAINIRGVTLGAAIQTVFSVAKVGALAVLVVFGLTVFRQPRGRRRQLLEPVGDGRLVACRHPDVRRGDGGLALLE